MDKVNISPRQVQAHLQLTTEVMDSPGSVLLSGNLNIHTAWAASTWVQHKCADVHAACFITVWVINSFVSHLELVRIKMKS